MIEGTSHQFIRQVLLFYIVLREIMSIQITYPMAQLLRSAIVLVLQMHRNRRGRRLYHVHGIKYRIASRIALRCGCYIRSRLGQNDLCLWHSYPFYCLGRCYSHLQRLGICISHIF